MTAKEVQAIKATMESFITNDLSSHLAKAIQHHFGAIPIAQDIAQYFQENLISSIPPPHKQEAWKAAIEGVVQQQIQAIPAPPRTEDIVAQVTQNLRSELSSLKTELIQIVPKTISSEEIQRQINAAVSGLSGPSSQGISEDKCNRMIRMALAARIIPPLSRPNRGTGTGTYQNSSQRKTSSDRHYRSTSRRKNQGSSGSSF